MNKTVFLLSALMELTGPREENQTNKQVHQTNNTNKFTVTIYKCCERNMQGNVERI